MRPVPLTAGSRTETIPKTSASSAEKNPTQFTARFGPAEIPVASSKITRAIAPPATQAAPLQKVR